jgi:hypothetical protein
LDRKRVLGILFITILLFTLSINVNNVYASPTKREYYDAGTDGVTSLGGAYWRSQGITTGVNSHTVTSIKLKMCKIGVPNTLTVSIRSSLTGSDLTSGIIDANSFTTDIAGLWYEINVTEYTLTANTVYYIVARALTGNAETNDAVYWRSVNGYPSYSSGTLWYSSNSGVQWGSLDVDLYFEIWGNDPTVSITITSTYTGTGYIKVNNVAQTTPYTNSYAPATVLLLEAISPRVITSNVEQKVYTSWSDSGNQIHNYTVSVGATVTANYHTEYKHIISASPISGIDILSIDDSAQISPYTTAWLDSGETISLNCTLFPTGHNGYAFNYWSDYLARHHHVTPTTSANYTAYYSITPLYGNSTINISGNATVTVNAIPHVLPYSFNATSGSEYNVTAIYTHVNGDATINISGNATVTVNTVPHILPYSFDAIEGSGYTITANSDYVIQTVTLNIDGNATITLDGSPVITPDSFILNNGSIYNLIANSGVGGSSIIYAPIILLSLTSLVLFSLVVAIGKKKRRR